MGFGLVIAVLGIGSTFAANININANDNTEFGQGVTKTVYCGGEEESITVSPLSKFVNGSYGNRVTRAAVQAVPENSFTANFATSVYTSNTSDFIVSAVATKVVNNRTGVWLTKKGTDSNITVASNQDQTTFSTQQRNDYVFSQNFATKRINNVDTRGFYKVNGTVAEKIVISAAIAAVAQATERYEIPGDFYFKGVVISDIPDDCSDKNFIVSGYNDEDPDAQTLIDLASGTDITEVTALWTREPTVLPKVSRDRASFIDISSNVTASQTASSLSLIFGNQTTQYLKTDDLYRLVIETQENTLGAANSANGGNGGNGRNERDDD
jgi:outer membrane protein W